MGAGRTLNALDLKVVGVTVFAHNSQRKNVVLSKQPAYVFAIVKKQALLPRLWMSGVWYGRPAGEVGRTGVI